MWAWLHGPGAVFRQPLQGSTNYLKAYDKFGNLLRVSGSRQKGEDEDGHEKATKTQHGSRDEDSEGLTDKGKLPPEAPEDLEPFPLNRFFRSHPVLSVELRDEIYRRVVEEGQTVRQISQDLFVDMRRVGAVIRLKTIEQQWSNQVGVFFHVWCLVLWV